MSRTRRFENLNYIKVVTDPIADLLTRIRNAIKAKHKTLEVHSSKEKMAIVNVMKDSGYIHDYEVLAGEQLKSTLKISLKYTGGSPALLHIERASKPGLRKYFKCDELPDVLNGLGVGVVSTSKGVISSKEAKKLRVGGEFLCFMY